MPLRTAGVMAALTQQELRAINEALAARLAGEIEDTGISPGDYESAKAKIEARIRWRAGE
jgi:hypothetical protein